MFADAGSNRSYRNINVADGHHGLSHHRDDPAKLEKISKINQFLTRNWLTLKKRKDTPEGSSIFRQLHDLLRSAISDGNRHNNENLPVLLAEKAGGQIDSGRHVRCTRDPHATCSCQC